MFTCATALSQALPAAYLINVPTSSCSLNNLPRHCVSRLVTLLTSLESPRLPCSTRKEYFLVRSAYGVWKRIIEKTCKSRTKYLRYSHPCRKDTKISSLGFSSNSRTVLVRTLKHSWHWLPSMGDSVTARHRAIPEDKVRIFQRSAFLDCSSNVTYI